jgi:hypothetical protein
MQSASSSADDNDLIRFLTAHGGRLRGLYDNSYVPATTTITEPSEYEYDYDDLHVHDVIDGFMTIFWYLTVIYFDKMMRIPSSVATMLCLFKLVHMREKSWPIHHHHHIDQRVMISFAVGRDMSGHDGHMSLTHHLGVSQ